MAYIQTPEGKVFETDHPEAWEGCKRMTKAEGRRLRSEQSVGRLREILKPGDRVYCVLWSVSASGMSRRISFYAIEDGLVRLLDGYIADVLSGVTRDRKEGLRVNGGGGMDMGFHVVSSLSAVLWPDGGHDMKHEWL